MEHIGLKIEILLKKKAGGYIEIIILDYMFVYNFKQKYNLISYIL